MTPVGLAAGLDRGAVGCTAFMNAGFGFVEVGPISCADEAAPAWSSALEPHPPDNGGRVVPLAPGGAHSDAVSVGF